MNKKTETEKKPKPKSEERTGTRLVRDDGTIMIVGYYLGKDRDEAE